MPDISKCEGRECPLKENCYRFTATPSEFRQSYFEDPPYKVFEEDGNEVSCDYYWPLEEVDETI